MEVKLHVPTLMCEGCVETVSNKILEQDLHASIKADLPNKLLIVNSKLTIETLQSAIQEAGHQFA